MRPIVQTLTNGQSLQIPLDTYLNPFSVTVSTVVTGTVTYSVQASNDNPWSGSAPTNFVPASTPGFNGIPISASSASAIGSITTPVRQLYVTVTAGTGSVTIEVVQSGQVG